MHKDLVGIRKNHETRKKQRGHTQSVTSTLKADCLSEKDTQIVRTISVNKEP